MSTSNNNHTGTDASRTNQPSEFELRRAALVGEIGESLEQVLTQINGLNRSLEGIIEIGNEFSSVEALWSQFETVMGRPDEEGANGVNSNATDAAGENVNADANYEVERGVSER
ncbi:Dolichyl-diphosphooligosaccharide-protein glycosyltransferase subunit dad1 [Cladophialophora chaetospira]|uniref:DASH complex subunit DAD1 n=1 Tax=Cladophialophora chaetospira TaxID=386627 RepID=A0AA39CKA5_9EURO|nr:Dolichyl-diphosphooligosaccharide-protein glycosyltransferase subunit dad1 [Cladophialophora chaetospira]